MGQDEELIVHYELVIPCILGSFTLIYLFTYLPIYLFPYFLISLFPYFLLTLAAHTSHAINDARAII
jgi:hypothetical protein